MQGRYTDQKPRDISPDQWPTISCENNYVFSSSPKSPSRAASTGGTPTRKSAPSPGKQATKGSTSQKKKPQGKTAGQSSKTAPPKKNPSQTSRKPRPKPSKPVESDDDRPISAGPDPKKNTSAKKQKQKKYTFTKKEQNRLKKNRKKFAMLIRKGMSRDEARVVLSLRQQKARRLGTFFSVLALFVFAFSLAASYCYYEGAAIREIVIEGDKTEYSDKQIIDAAGINVGQSMLTVREGKVNGLLQSQLPFISGVNIRYDFPDTLKINVVSTEEKCIVKKGNKYMCLDKNGKIVSLKKMKTGKEQYLVTGLDFDSPVIGDTFVPMEYELSDEDKDGKTDYEIEKLEKEIGKKSAAEKRRYEVVLEIVRFCSKYGLMEGGKIDVTDLNAIEILYDSRVKIFLGSDDDIEMKISAAVRILEEKTSRVKRRDLT